MYGTPLLRLFKNMVERVIFHRDNAVLARLPTPGYYNPSTKTLTLAEGLDDEALFRTAYTILLKRLHPKDPETLCRERAREMMYHLSRSELALVVDYLEDRTSPLKLL